MRNTAGRDASGQLAPAEVSAGLGEQGVRKRRNYQCAGFVLFDNSVDCTRQPENEKANKNKMDESIIHRVVKNP